MGLKIWELFPKKDIEIQDLKGKKLALDTSSILYQFLASIRQRDGTPLTDKKGNITSHLMGLLTRSTSLMASGLKIAWIFDGKPPALKFKEKERRELLKQKAIESYKKAKTSEEKIKFAKRTSRLTPKIVKESKELLKALGLPIIQAVSEAEAQCAFMAEKKDVWATVSQDADALLYSTPRLIRNLTVSQRRRLPTGTYIKNNPELIELKQVLKKLKINQDQLMIIAILTGTDYNPGGVFRIGQKTALKLVKQYKSFDKLFKEVAPNFNWKKVYAIFKSMPIMKNYQLKWKEINSEKVKKILVDKHDFAEERVDNMIQRVTQRPKNQSGLSKWAK